MDIFKFLTSIISFVFIFLKAIKIRVKRYYCKVFGTFRRIYRLLNVKKRSEIVWEELIKFHKEEGWNFGQFDNKKYIETIFNLDDDFRIKFTYQ